MPLYESIEYTIYASEQMRYRHISQTDVELVLGVGEGQPGRRESGCSNSAGFVWWS